MRARTDRVRPYRSAPQLVRCESCVCSARHSASNRSVVPNRLRQVRPDSQRAAAARVPELAGGGQHHDRGATQLRMHGHLFGHGKAVHLRHVRVEENQSEWMTLAATHRRARRARRRRCPRHMASSATGSSSSTKNSPVHLVVVDDQHRQIDEHRLVRPRLNVRDRRKRRGEMEGAALAGFAVDPDAAAHELHERRANRQAKPRSAEAPASSIRPPG